MWQRCNDVSYKPAATIYRTHKEITLLPLRWGSNIQHVGTSVPHLTLSQLRTAQYYSFFIVLLTVHLSIILVINQLNAQILFYNKFIICLYMFRALCAHHQEVQIVYSLWYHHTCRWPPGAQFLSQPVQGTTTYRCDDTRYCIVQF